MAGQAKVFIGEKLTQLERAEKSFSICEARDLGLKVCRLGRWNAKNNRRDYRIARNCVGITELENIIGNPQICPKRIDTVAGL